MNSSRLNDISAWSSGALISGIPSEEITKISTDTRTISQGDAFLALKGDNFNGHDFVQKAIDDGATTLILSELPKETDDFSGNVIHVRDTLKALQEIALNYRREMIPRVRAIGITGSNGKTSTKDFLRGVLSQAGKVNATKGNLNNHIGLPMTVLDTEKEHRYGVWEMGMNHPGEIGPLAEIAAPDCAVVTNVGTAHIEHMKTREAIADEKAALPRAVLKDGFCVMPETDDYFDRVKDQIFCKMIGVGGENSPVRAENIEIGLDTVAYDLCLEGKKASVNLPVTGRHMVMNSLLAAAVGHVAGISIEEIAAGLTASEVSGGRLEKDEWNGVAILNDSYNANPDSVKAALISLKESPSPGRKIAALGYMGELGEHEEAGHREIGAFAVEQGIDLLVTVSEKAKLIAEEAAEKIPTESFDNHDQAAAFLQNELKPGDTLLVKGSRAAAMEKVIGNLKAN